MKYYRVKNQSQFYRDLRSEADDKTVLENPHKGWYYHYVDNGMHRPFYRDKVAPGYYFEDVPALKQIYLRLDWVDIEPEEGKFDWSYVDRVMEEWGAKGFTFSFRFCTYEAGLLGREYATPKWVFDKGAKSYNIKGFHEPIYDDPIFLENLDHFLAECGRKLDGHPLVEYVDVGCYGTWGEFHTFFGSEIVYPYEVVKKYIDLAHRHFRETMLMVAYGASTNLLKTGDEEGANRIVDYCVQLGIGLRDDSINVEWYAKTFGYNTLSTTDIFPLFNAIAPVDLEHTHLRLTPDELMRGGFAFADALKTAGATYAGFHGYLEEWYPKYKYAHEYIANRLGYWFFVQGYAISGLFSGAKAILSLDVVNHGWAKAYRSYEARVRLTGADGSVYDLPCTGCDCTRWLPEEELTEHLKLDLQGVPAGDYTLSFGLFSGERAIRLALKAELEQNGFYRLGEVTVEP